MLSHTDLLQIKGKTVKDVESDNVKVILHFTDNTQLTIDTSNIEEIYFDATKREIDPSVTLVNQTQKMLKDLMDSCVYDSGYRGYIIPLTDSFFTELVNFAKKYHIYYDKEKDRYFIREK